jgi:hypothetical protein
VKEGRCARDRDYPPVLAAASAEQGPSRGAPQLVLAVQAMVGERGVDPMRYTRAQARCYLRVVEG